MQSLFVLYTADKVPWGTIATSESTWLVQLTILRLISKSLRVIQKSSLVSWRVSPTWWNGFFRSKLKCWSSWGVMRKITRKEKVRRNTGSFQGIIVNWVTKKISRNVCHIFEGIREVSKELSRSIWQFTRMTKKVSRMTGTLRFESRLSLLLYEQCYHTKEGQPRVNTL